MSAAESAKSCHICQHFRREQIGPHEWTAHCALHQRDFLAADDCNFYQPEPVGAIDEGEHWPRRQGWEVTT